MSMDAAIARAEEVLAQAAHARAAAEAAEARLKHTLSVMAVHYRQDGKAIGEAEHLARASQPGTEALETWIAANAEYRRLDAKAEATRLRFEAWRTANATERAKMQLR